VILILPALPGFGFVNSFDKFSGNDYFIPMRLCLVIGWLMMGSAVCFADALPREILPAREAFEVGLQVAEKEGQGRLNALGDEYLQALRNLKNEMQTNAQFRGLVEVHDEIARFAKARVLPPHPIEEPVELHDAQALYQLKTIQTQFSNEFALVRLADRYVQQLAAVREIVEKMGGSSAMLRAVDEECERVVNLERLRRALEGTKVRPPSSLEVGTNGLASAAETEQVRRPMDLCRPANESLQTTIGYAIRATVFEDFSRIKTRKTEGVTKGRTTDGQTAYVPRIVLTCQRGEVPSGSRLVIEYYSRALTEHAHHREAVESVLLPRLDRGENFTVEAKGIQLYRFEQVMANRGVGGVTRNFYGSEFYGLILHLVDPDGRVLLQRFAPQALEHELGKPPEK